MSQPSDIWTVHSQADARGERFYVDPDTGLHVFTRHGLRERGTCCGSGCRHCPYAHHNVPLSRRSAAAQQPTWLTPEAPANQVDLLFWSGGKDSYLAYRALRRANNKHTIVLLTTFDATRRRIAHQELELNQIVRQAEHLRVPLVGVPLHPGRDYLEQVEAGIALVPRVERLVFGDLHLQHIREWRETAFAPLLTRLHAVLHFPLWHVEYERLLDDLESSRIVCEVAAVPDPASTGIAVGDRFDRALMNALPPEVDPFGERGEFHTVAKVWERS